MNYRIKIEAHFITTKTMYHTKSVCVCGHKFNTIEYLMRDMVLKMFCLFSREYS